MIDRKNFEMWTFFLMHFVPFVKLMTYEYKRDVLPQNKGQTETSLGYKQD